MLPGWRGSGTTAQTWDAALDRARAAANQSPQVAANFAVLTQLRERWEDSVDMLTSMFDLVAVPSGAGWPRGNDVDFVQMTHDQRSGEPAVKVGLYRSRSRSSLTQPGGTMLVAGDICRPVTAPAVVEAFLLQLARPADSDRY
jgi:hypothetical protein